MASHSLGKVEAYLTVREILPETSKGVDGVAWCEFSGFGRQQVCNVRVKILRPAQSGTQDDNFSLGGACPACPERSLRELAEGLEMTNRAFTIVVTQSAPGEGKGCFRTDTKWLLPSV